MAYRYAVYYAPSTSSPLGAFGAEWLGRTIEGQDLAAPTLAGVSIDDWQSATAAPRKYGFHATLKPPFRLAEGTSEEELISAVESFCAESTPADLGTMSIDRISGFLALTPERKDAVGRLAANIVRELDRFRAPLTPKEIERRKPATLSASQRTLLESWGYPYVMGEFRFHMTLTGNLTAGDAEIFRIECERALSVDARQGVSVDDLCLFQEPDPGGDLVLMRRFPLGQRI